MSQHKDLRVWWTPEIGGESFIYPVTSVEEAHLILELLSDYDEFLFYHDRPSGYNNVGGIESYYDDPKHPRWVQHLG